MATDFPDTSINNPNTGVGWANGDAFDDTANSGLIYYWYDPVWKTSLSSADADAKYVEIDGDTMTGDLTVPSLNGGPLAGFRNQIINGDFRVWQRGTDFNAPADLTYTSDRWAVTFGSGRVLRTTDAPLGFNYAAALYTTQRQSLVQMIELDRTGHPGQFAVGTTWTVSFYLKGDVGAGSINVGTRFVDDISGTNLVSIMPYTLTNYDNTWTRYSHTFTIAATPAGTNTAMNVTFDSQGGSPGSNNTLAITGVQLEPGPVATPFEHRPIGTELALCQRYYVNDLRGEFGASPRNSDNVGVLNFVFPVEMRVTPTTKTATVGTAYNAYTKGISVFSTSDSWSTVVTADAEL